MLFNPNEIEDLSENIEVFHCIFIAQNIGAEMLSRADRKLLKKHDIDYKKFKQTPDFIKYAYDFGKLEYTIQDKTQLKKLNLVSYKEFIKENPDKIPVRRKDYWDLKTIKQQAYNDIKRLNNRVKTDFVDHLIETSKTQRLKVERVLRKEVKGKAVSEEIISKLNSFLAKKTKQWMGHFEAISIYNMTSAYNHGIASEMFVSYGEQAKVYYHVYPDACDHCKRVYLRKDGTPKIFYLRVLMNNGTNIGVKAVNYKPTLSPLHNRCRCKPVIYPTKTGRDVKFNPSTQTYQRIFK